MVLRIIRSKICRTSNFHRPNFCTSHMPKTTRPDLPMDEMARRKECQKIIDYTFGPPLLHEHDDIRSDLAQTEDHDSATNLMENLKDKPLHSTHAIFGQAHRSTQNGEELWSQQNLQEAHRINSQNWPRQAPQTDFGECRADSSNFYSAQHMGCPHYYRQMEAQMYDNFAQKYLRTETDEIDKLDKLLAKEMESLELPKPERKGMRAPINISNNVDTVYKRSYHTDAPVTSQTVAPAHNNHWCTHCCQYFPPHLNVNDTTTINLFDDNVEEGFTLESNPYGYHDDILPINVIHCSDLPLNCVTKSSNPPNEKLQLDEYEPCHLLQPVPLVQDRCVEWDDKSLKIEQPIESSEKIVQILAHAESAVDSNLQNIQVNESSDHHMIQEARQPYNVNYNHQIEPKNFQQQLHPLTKMNLIETNISEHINTHQESYVQPHLEIEQTTEPLKPWTEEKLKKMIRDNLVNPSPVENTESEPRQTDAAEQNFMHATPQCLEQQARFNSCAAENTEPSPQQQTWVNPDGVENTEADPRRTDVEVQNFVQATPHSLEQQASYNSCAAENTEPSPVETWANPDGVENTEPDLRRTDVEIQNFVEATPHGLEQQARFNPFAAENTEPSPQQQKWAPFGVENKEPSLQRTDSMVRHCVHSPSIPHSVPNARITDPVDDILTNIHLDENLSLSELLQRVRALNRLQYCRECGMAVLSKCPPTDRPQCPPPPDCARDCPPPEKPKCTPCPECPPEPSCPPPPPKCPSEPICPPPKPKCPPEPKCPPPAPPMCPPPPEKKPKCPSPCPPPTGPGKCGCQSTEPAHPVSIHSLLKSKLSEYVMGLISQGFFKLKHTLSLDSLVFEATHPNDRETLQLNRVKDFEPWVPLPSWPYPVDVKKKKLQCPAEGCPGPKQFPWRPNCPPLPCSGFPKRLKISEAN